MTLPRLAYRVSEVAESLGLDDETVRRWCVSGEIPAVKRGKVWLIALADLERWLHADADGRARTGHDPAGAERPLARGRDDGRPSSRDRRDRGWYPDAVRAGRPGDQAR